MGHPSGFGGLKEGGSRLRTNAHLSDDKTVAKMGHPALVEITILVAG